MDKDHFTPVQKLTISAMIMALYVVVMLLTQSFAFGAYQIRIATSLYALSFLFPFLVLPLGLANCLSNLIGGLGLLDIFGGLIIGILTAGAVALIRRKGWSRYWAALPVLLIPGLGVATWLSYLLNIPYPAMALSLCIGQALPAVCGVALIEILDRVLFRRGKAAVQKGGDGK